MRAALLIAFALSWRCAVAAAQPAPAAPRPPPADEAEARSLFATANQRFTDRDFARAIELYKLALVKWEQPAIRFNLAIALIEVDRTREAYLHLQAALRDPVALGERASEARNYVKLLRGRLATVRVTCPLGATCEIDGETLVPGTSTLTLEPGAHTLAARKPGFEGMSETLQLEPGKHRDLPIALQRPSVRLVRRFPAWLPWAVVGAGTIGAVGGGISYALGRSDVRSAQDEIDVRCRAGCTPAPADLVARAERGLDRQQLGIGVLVGGGVVLLTGAVLVALNSPRAEDGRAAAIATQSSSRWALAIAPLDGGGIATLGGDF